MFQSLCVHCPAMSALPAVPAAPRECRRCRRSGPRALRARSCGGAAGPCPAQFPPPAGRWRRCPAAGAACARGAALGRTRRGAPAPSPGLGRASGSAPSSPGDPAQVGTSARLYRAVWWISSCCSSGGLCPAVRIRSPSDGRAVVTQGGGQPWAGALAAAVVGVHTAPGREEGLSCSHCLSCPLHVCCPRSASSRRGH